MEEFYRIIEEKIKASGCPYPLSGKDIYNDICDQMEDKENGTYLLLSKSVIPPQVPVMEHEEEFFIEYRVDVMEEEFNLSIMDIHIKDNVYCIHFDE